MSKRKDQCLFCKSRRCCTRIVTNDFSYDEIACIKHGRDLEDHADRSLNGALRTNISSSATVSRGEENPAVSAKVD